MRRGKYFKYYNSALILIWAVVAGWSYRTHNIVTLIFSVWCLGYRMGIPIEDKLMEMDEEIK